MRRAILCMHRLVVARLAVFVVPEVVKAAVELGGMGSC